MLVDYRSKIVDAFDSAPIFSNLSPAETTSDNPSQLKDKPDDFPIEWRIENNPPLDDNIIFVPGLTELRRLMQDYLRVTDNPPDYDELIQREIKHETEHAKACFDLGATAVGYTLTLFKYENKPGLYTPAWQLTTMADRISSTKLGMAAIFVQPSRPSNGDIATIKSFGYRDITDIGSRISTNNSNPLNQQLPIPMSYKQP